MIAPSPGCAMPPDAVRGNLAVARRFLMIAPSPNCAMPPEEVLVVGNDWLFV